MQHDQQTAEWTTQLIEYQLEATLMLETGELRERLLKVITGMSVCGPYIKWPPNGSDLIHDSHREINCENGQAAGTDESLSC